MPRINIIFCVPCTHIMLCVCAVKRLKYVHTFLITFNYFSVYKSGNPILMNHFGFFPLPRSSSSFLCCVLLLLVFPPQQIIIMTHKT